MAIIYAQNIIEVAIQGRYGGRDVANVLHVHNDEGMQSDGAAVTDVLSNWQDHVMSVISNQYTLLGAVWRSLDPDDTNQGEVAPVTGKRTVGANTNSPMSGNNNLLVRKVTANRQRGQRDGRMFICGIVEENVNNDGLIVAAYKTSWQTALNDFFNGVTDGDFGTSGSGLAVLNSTPESREPGTMPVTLTWRRVSSLVAEDKIGLQERRIGR